MNIFLKFKLKFNNKGDISFQEGIICNINLWSRKIFEVGCGIRRYGILIKMEFLVVEIVKLFIYIIKVVGFFCNEIDVEYVKIIQYIIYFLFLLFIINSNLVMFEFF